jgi:molecular chaperone DnaK (HSP70)
LLLDVTPLYWVLKLGGVSTRLIEANTTIPTKKTETLRLLQTVSLCRDPYAGERPWHRTKTIGRFHLDGIPPAPEFPRLRLLLISTQTEFSTYRLRTKVPENSKASVLKLQPAFRRMKSTG